MSVIVIFPLLCVFFLLLKSYALKSTEFNISMQGER